MPAKLIIVTGPKPGTEFQIQEEVLRLGSGAHCEICLSAADVAAHVATLEYRSGAYQLHNRSEAPIEIHGRRLDLRESAPWPAGEEVALGHGLTLRLEVEGDPAPAKVSAPASTIEYDADEEVEESEAVVDRAKAAEAAVSSKKNFQVFVILGCVLLGALMLYKGQATEEPQRDRRADLRNIIKKLADDPVDNARGPLSLRTALQTARSAELRGDTREARKAYGIVRDLLVKCRRPDGTFSEDHQEIWSLLNSRIQSLESGTLP